MPHPASFLWLDVTARRGMKKSQCQQQDSRGPHNCEQATGVLTWSSSFRPSLRFGAVSVSLSLSMGSGLLTTMIRLRMMRCCCCTSSPGYYFKTSLWGHSWTHTNGHLGWVRALWPNNRSIWMWYILHSVHGSCKFSHPHLSLHHYHCIWLCVALVFLRLFHRSSSPSFLVL